MSRSESNRPFRFTDQSIQAILPPKEKRETYHDTQVPQLGMLVQPSGYKSFFWFSKVRGKPTWRGIGSIEKVSIAQARTKAKALTGALTAWQLNDFKGEYPFAEKISRTPAFADLLEGYVTRHVRARAKRPERAERNVRWMVDKYMESWKSRKLSDIKRKDVLDLHAEIGKAHGHTTANRLIEVLRAMFGFAQTQESFSGENPASKIAKFHEEKRERFLALDELSRLSAALKDEPNPDLVDYVKLALWTGARKSDVLAMRWQDISVDRWDVPDPKSRRPYSIPLVPEAVGILNARRQNQPEESVWVFPSRGSTGHVVDLKGRWKQLLKRAQLTNVRQHDLRRTLGSYQAGLGASLPVIAKSLGHASVQATQVYSRLDLAPVRASVLAATRLMLSAEVAASAKTKQLKAGRHG